MSDRKPNRTPSGPPGLSRGRTALLVGASLVVVAWFVAVGLSLNNARADAFAGLRLVDELQSGLDLDLDTVGDRAGDGDTVASLEAAAAHFGGAERSLSRPWVRVLHPVPLVGTQLRSGHALARAAADLAGAGVELHRSAVALRAGLDDDRLTRGDAVRELASMTAAALPAFDADLGPRNGLLPQLAEAHERIRTERSEVRDELATADVALRGLVSFLEERRYLILAANTSEMRVGAGAVLQTATLTTTTDGGFRLDEARSVSDVVIQSFRPSRDLHVATNWGFLLPARAWQNVAMTPRFPVVAANAAQMAAAASPDAPPIDGVLLVDPVALRDLLTLTGPVTVRDLSVNADNVLAVLGYEQYQRFDENNELRQDLLGELAAEVVGRVATTEADPQRIIDALRRSARGRHLLAWSPEQVQQAGWRALGVSGELSGAEVQVALSNHGANKLDYFTTIDASITSAASAASPDTVEVAVQVRLTNTVSGPQPSNVVGELDLGAPGRYFGFLTLTLPGFAADVRIDELFDGAVVDQRPGYGEQQQIFSSRRIDALVANGTDGRGRVVSVSVAVDPGAPVTRTVRFRVPATLASAVQIVPSARWPQIRWATPGVTDDAVSPLPPPG